MATFYIKRGDTMPPLIIALKVAGSDPTKYFDVTHDTIDSSIGNGKPNSAGSVISSNYQVRFIMTPLDSVGVTTSGGITGARPLVGLAANVTAGFTGKGTLYQVETGEVVEGSDPVEQVMKTYVRYDWKAPTYKTDGSVDYAGDTAKAGLYECEFEIFYTEGSEVTEYAELKKLKKRSFPSAFGDTLIVNILADLNDKTPTEAK